MAYDIQQLYQLPEGQVDLEVLVCHLRLKILADPKKEQAQLSKKIYPKQDQMTWDYSSVHVQVL